MNLMKQVAAAALLATALAATARAEVIQFSDAKTKSFLGSWTVWIDGKERGITDAHGRFRINDRSDNIEVTLKHVGAPDKKVKITTTGKPGLVSVPVP
jgi:hypothetical protein